MSDEKLTALVRAIANELVELGYVPDEQPGKVQHSGKEEIKVVAEEIWAAMRDILAGAKP